MLRQFRQDSSYIVAYELKQLMVVSSAIAVLVWWNPWGMTDLPRLFLLCVPLLFSGPVGYLFTAMGVFAYLRPESGFDSITAGSLCLAGVSFGLAHSQLVHFCSHNLLRPRWLNRALGEVLSLQFFGTFLGFTVLHLEHHAFADDLVQDPHPNEGEGFYRFFIRLSRTMASGFKKIYFKLHGQTPAGSEQWRRYSLLVPTRCFSRAILFLLLLGPEGFLFFLLPSMISNHWVFGHLNYYSHLRKPDGTVEILNLNQTLFHKLLNLLTLGAYNHANHHQAPNALYPPQRKVRS